MKIEQVIRASVIGSKALEMLQRTGRGQMTGQTSGGVFLRTDADRILFLSFVSWRGPLTINLSTADRENLIFDLHSPFLIRDGAILFQEEAIAIYFDRATLWSPPPRPKSLDSPEERAQRFSRVKEPITAALERRFHPDQEVDPISASPSGIELASLDALRIAVKSRQPAGIATALVAGLGNGPGLTPAGDDLVLGFLLALNRWGNRLCPDLPPEPINRALVEAARQRTTALSASLIECAANGLADERLVLALDGLVSGNLTEDRIVDHFQDWGHTSGAAALAGMELVLE